MNKLPLVGLLVAMLVAGIACAPAAPNRKPTPASPFELTNQFGQTTSLSLLKGKVVVLTFLYSSCPDACPLLISKIQKAMTELGSLADEVTLVAITVDPERDTVERLREYTSSLPFDWQYLTGEPEQLKAVWDSHGVLVEKQGEKLTSAGQKIAGDEGHEVIHTTIIVLIDKEGFQDTLVGGGPFFQSVELEEKLRSLLTGKKK